MLTLQFCLLESTNEFVVNKFNKLKDRRGSDVSSLSSFQVHKVCTRDEMKDCNKDQLGFEAISMLHSQIDDDQNGNLDRSESHDFFKEDLKKDPFSYVSHYHKDDDLVSVHDLWHFWVLSEVHNWTVEDVILWLDLHVELGQYAEQFRRQEIDGSLLPRLACSIHNPLYSIMGIKNVKHRQKISLKATDIVLFGIPKSQRSIFSDTLFFFSILLALAGCGLGYRQHKLAKLQLHILSNDLRNLQSAEESLKKFKAQLEESQRKQREEEDRRDELKKMLVNKEFKVGGYEDDEDDIGDLKIKNIQEELAQCRLELMEAEFRLEECRRASIPDLQQWLQLTYEVESRYIEERGNEVFKRLQEAKKMNSGINIFILMCESMRRQKLKLLSSIRSPAKPPEFETSDVNQSLEEIKKDLEERAVRWKEIERITSFNITTNPGIPYLNALLRGPTSGIVPIPGMIPSPSLSKIPTLPGHLSTYPIMSNLLKAGMQLSAVGINSCMIGNRDESPPKQENLASLPDNLSQASLVSLDRNGFSSMKYLKHNNPPLVKSFTPPYHLSSMQRYPYKSTPSFYVTLIEESMDGFLHPEGNMNNNVKLKLQNPCNGHKKESKKFKSPLKLSRKV